jgi:L1 cell adhesion molecule like protein
MSDNEVVLGIDLGTTYSVVSIFQNNNPKVIQDEIGNKIIPSFIAFENENKMLVGDMAKAKLGQKGIAVIYDAKRLIGRTFDDPHVSKDKVNWPFSIKKDEKTNKPIIVIKAKKIMGYIKDFETSETIPLGNYSNSAKKEIPTVEKEFTPEEISSYILKKLKEMAERELDKKLKKAVITVPAYFNNSQRESTKIAGELAGLEVLRIINEPTAAALAYGLNENNDNENKNILVFDLGGGTFDVTILSMEYDENDDEKIFEVKSTDGDTHLGGQDFDQKLYDLASQKFAQENNNTDLGANLEAKNRLKKACEKAKINLSKKEITTIKLDKLYLSANLEITFRKDEFEKLCKPLFDKCLKTIDNALKLAKLKENDINFIVMIGGSTRIPYIRNMLEKKFRNSKLNYSINPDEAVSIGAAIQGAILTHKKDTKIRNVNLFDVTPLSLGVEVVGEKMDFNINRNTPTPIKRTKMYKTVKDYSTSVCIKVYEGEDINIKNNHFLGKFTINNLPKLKAGQAKVEVTFLVDENNILNVSAVDASNEQNKNEIIIINDSIIINKEEKEKIKKNMAKYDVFDKKNEINLIETRSLKKDIIKFTTEIEKTNDKKIKYINHKKLCKSCEKFMKIFDKDLDKLGKNDALLSKFNYYLTYLVKEYGVILSFGNLVEEDVINNMRINLYTYVIILIQISKVSIYELLQDLTINKKINDFCCIFRILENYTQGKILHQNKEMKEAGKCFTNILQEASLHDLETQLSYIDKDSGNKIRKYVSDANSYLEKFYIQNVIDEADNFYKSAVRDGILFDLNILKQSLDSYNYAIQLNKIGKENEPDEIIDKYKYDYCLYKINGILIHNLGEKNEKMKKFLEKLQKDLEKKNECNEKEKKQIEKMKKENKNLHNETTKMIKIKNPNYFKEYDNVMKNINRDLKKTAKDFIKLILKDSPYNGYNNEYNDEKIDEIFNKGNEEIKKFIKRLKIKYSPNKIDKNLKDQYLAAQTISSHLNNILSSIDN